MVWLVALAQDAATTAQDANKTGLRRFMWDRNRGVKGETTTGLQG
jgi:hypothetical protein